MGNYFSSPGQYDYGSEYIYKGAAALGQGIAQGASSVFNHWQDNQDKEKEIDRTIVEASRPAGGPVMVNGKLDRTATMQKVSDWHDQHALKQHNDLAAADYNFDLGNQLKAYGQDGSTGGGDSAASAVAAAKATFDGALKSRVMAHAAAMGAPAVAPATPFAAPTATAAPASPSAQFASPEMRLRQAKEAADLATSQRSEQAKADIHERERRQMVMAAQLDKYEQLTGTPPPPSHLGTDGNLNAAGLHVLQSAETKLASGYMRDPDHAGQWLAVPGGPAELQQKLAAQKIADAQGAAATKDASRKQAEQSLAASHANIVDNIDKLIGNPKDPNDKGSLGFWNTGSLLGRTPSQYNPMSGANNVHAQLESVKAGLGLDWINALKAASANGNSGIGRVLEVEFAAAAAAQRNLAESQDESELRKNLADLRMHMVSIKHLIGDSGNGVQSLVDKYRTKPKTP